VTCGTAPFSHREVVLDALRCGKHVLTEKPFAMSLQEGREMVDEAARANRTLAVVHNFQFAASTRRARRWIDEGRLGAVRGLVAVQYSNPHRRLPEWTEQLPLGLFYDESPHLLYMVRDLAPGPLEALRATTYPSTLGLPATPAQVELQLVAGDVPVTVLMNFEAPVSEWHVNILGEHALCSIDLFRDIAVLIPNDGRHSTREVLRSSVAATAGHWMGHGRSGWGHLRKRLRYGNDEVFTRFMRASRSATAPIGISGADALEVLELQHWVIDQAETVRGPV
jgi:predicted dehydrogenase